MITTERIFCYVLDLPESIPAFTRHNTDDSYTVILNAHHTRERNQQALVHELAHIYGDDWGSTDADEIERSAHERLRNVPQEESFGL